jgi:hypothetical protein
MIAATFLATAGPDGADAAAAAPDVCSPLSSGKVDTTGEPSSVTVSAPAGYKIRRYCVKAGAAPAGGGPVYVAVDPPRQAVTITHPTGKAVSHWSIEYSSCTTTPTEPGETSPGEEPTLPETSPEEPAETPEDTSSPESPGDTTSPETPGDTTSPETPSDTATPDTSGDTEGPGSTRPGRSCPACPAGATTAATPQVSPSPADTDLAPPILCRVNAGAVAVTSSSGSNTDGGGDGSAWIVLGTIMLAGALLVGTGLVRQGGGGRGPDQPRE